MRRWLKNTHFLYKLLAVVVAVVLWFYVMGVTDPTVTRTFSDIPVSLTGKDILYDNYGYTVIDGDKSVVSVSVTGNRSKILRVTKENIAAEADVSTVKSTGTSAVQCRITLPDTSLRTENINTVRASVTIDKIIERDIPVKLQYNSSTDSGYMLGQTSVSPEVVSVKGPESELDEIAFALVDITQEKFSTSFYEDALFQFIDQDKKTVTPKYSTCVTERVRVSIPVLAIKNLPLDVHIQEGGGLTANNVELTITPQVIKVAGEESALSSIEKVWLSTVQLDELTAGFNKTFKVTLPEGIENIANITSADVKFTLVGVASKSFLVNKFDIINPPQNAVIKTVETQMQVELWGDTELVNAVNRGDIKLVVDLGDIADPGTYVVPAEVVVENGEETKPRVTKKYNVHVVVEDIESSGVEPAE